MDINPESIAAIGGIIGAFVACGTTYGIMSTRIDNLEKQLIDIKSSTKDFVDLDHFSVVGNNMQQELANVREDLKEVKADVKDLIKITKNG